MTVDRNIERRRFLASAAVLGFPAMHGVDPVRSPLAPADHFPRNDPDRVAAVVGASHGNFDRVRQLVTEQPALAKASWDWGFGDWETALGAASHTGRREIAEYLIGHGARPTVFSAAMLGDVDTVRAFLSRDGDLATLLGPHGISLMRHARSGGADAQHVVDYLLSEFGEDEIEFGYPGDDSVEARYGGRFRFREDPALELSVGVRNGWLMVGAGAEPSSRVLRLAGDTFHPTGAPGVRLRFEIVDGRAETLHLEDGPVSLTGARIGDRD